MSLNAFKESLKPCNSRFSTYSFPSTQPEPSTSSNSLLPAIPRKPPKSSLSQQLLRLEQDFSLSPLRPHREENLPKEEHPKRRRRIEDDNQSQKVANSDGGEEEEEEEEQEYEIGRQGTNSLSFEPSGPYVPLVLSDPGSIPLVQVPASINCRLLEHQRGGIEFLYRLYRSNHGGILGDDMGLGKTIQTIAFLAAVYAKDGESGVYSTGHGNDGNQTVDKGPVLIICPSSVIRNWQDEFSKWANFSVSIFHGPNRDVILDKVRARGVEILITSFDTFRVQGSSLSNINWEIVVVDEAHRLKNEKSKLYEACLEIKTKKRYGLTGTILQNKIMELFNLFDWVSPRCLGSREHFREYYDEPLKHGQRSSAPERFVQVADERKQHLVAVLRKYLLRRTKDETIGHLMLGKEDNVVFCAMSELQKRAYRRMLQLPEIQCLMNKDLPCGCGSPLTQVECCKRTVPDGIIWRYLHRDSPEGCNSCPFCVVLPCLMKLQQISNHLELIKPNPKDETDKQKKDAEFSAAVLGSDMDQAGGITQNESFMGLSDVKHCGKMRALEKLMSSWVAQGDKILLFSHSVRMLDILEKLLIRKGYCFSRLDGSTPTGSRQTLVDDFNSSPSKQVFLISTRAGGLGLNLVSANRVVIFDPNWNPSHDLQAQDRSFRFGQKRHVVVFRLLAAGSLEELVYSRQVYKQQLSNIAVSGKMEKRYFEGVQDCKEFQGELFGIHNLFRDLSDKLFTSEIIEQGQECIKLGTKQSNCDNIGTDELSCSRTHNENLGQVQAVGKASMDEEWGIVYAHRNEDVINFGPGDEGDGDLKRTDNMSQQPHLPESSWSFDGVSSSRDRKRKQFSLIAEFMEMDESEFSEWVLSATPKELEGVLQDYKKKKKKGKKKMRTKS